MAQITTSKQTWTNMKDLAENSELMRRSKEFEKNFCPSCGYLICRCEQIRAQKEQEERMAPLLAQRAKKEQEAREIQRLGGTRAYEDFTAERFTNKTLLQAMAQFPKENYYLWGKAGTGKTHAAVAVLRLHAQGQVTRMAQISRRLRGCETADEEEKVLDFYANAILLLDDLGSEKATEFLQNSLFEIMERRWQNKRGGLIITSNMDIAHLGSVVGDRTASRIAGLTGGANMLEISGTDHRIN